MVKVTINNKTYNVSELTIGDYSKMEEQGFSVLEAFQKKQTFLIAMGFVCAVTGLDRTEAENLLTQHVLGGGNIMEIVAKFNEAVADSDFFLRLLGLNTEETEKPQKKTSKKETE